MSDIPTTKPDSTRLTELSFHISPVDDNWSGITNQKERRKIQNRFAQRAYRQRHTQNSKLKMKFFHPSGDKTSETPEKKHVFLKYPARLETTPPRDSEPHIIENSNDTPTASTSVHIPTLPESNTLDLSVKNMPNMDIDVEDIIRHTDLDHPPRSADSLISVDHKYIDLVYYNLFRAFQINTGSLGLTTFALTLDILSPFNSIAPEEGLNPSQGEIVPAINNLNLNLPPALQPTYIQITTPHHPYIDIFPSPQLRDNFILAGDAIDDMELCFDMMGSCWEEGHGFAGFIVWGNPWDPLGWEVTEKFAEKWKWVFEGVEDVLVGTNHWRSQRGLGELSLKV